MITTIFGRDHRFYLRESFVEQSTYGIESDALDLLEEIPLSRR